MFIHSVMTEKLEKMKMGGKIKGSSVWLSRNKERKEKRGTTNSKFFPGNGWKKIKQNKSSLEEKINLSFKTLFPCLTEELGNIENLYSVKTVLKKDERMTTHFPFFLCASPFPMTKLGIHV